MLMSYKRGQTGVILRVKILDSSVSTGAGLTGLTSASTGLIIATIADNEATATAYTVAGSNVETITTLGTYAAPTSGKCRFKEVDATNHKGVYEIQIADARYAVSSAKSLLVSISGATNAAQTDVVIALRDLDPYDAVRAGLTALPNAAAEASGGLITRGTSTGQLSVASGVAQADLAKILGTAPTEGAAGRLAGAFTTLFNVASPVLTAASVNQTGDAYARLGAPAGASVSADIAAVKTDTGNLVTRITSTLFSGITSLAQWLGLLAGKQTGNSTARTELRATGAGSGTFDETTDSQEALRDRGDAAWITATGFSTLDAAGVRTAIGLATNNLDTQLGLLATATNLATANTNISAIKAKTDNLPSDPASASSFTTVVTHLTDIKGATFSGSTDSLEAIRDRGDAAWITGSGGLDAAGVRTALGMATNNLDTQLALRTGFKLASDGLDLVVLETGVNARQGLSGIAAACFGVISGAGTGTVVIRAAANSGTTRITATVDESGNRSAVTLSLPT